MQLARPGVNDPHAPCPACLVALVSLVHRELIKLGSQRPPPPSAESGLEPGVEAWQLTGHLAQHLTQVDWSITAMPKWLETLAATAMPMQLDPELLFDQGMYGFAPLGFS